MPALRPSADTAVARSPEILNRARSSLLIVDMQERLMPVIPDAAAVTATCVYLMKAAHVMGVPTFASEQYPKGLGPTVEAVSGQIQQNAGLTFEKLQFSAAPEFQNVCRQHNRQVLSETGRQVVVVGIETHICVLQTALDLLSRGLRVYVVEDAVSSRHKSDWDSALRRIRDSGGVVTTAESVAFEWCEIAGTDEFRTISRLTRERDSVR